VIELEILGKIGRVKIKQQIAQFVDHKQAI